MTPFGVELSSPRPLIPEPPALSAPNCVLVVSTATAQLADRFGRLKAEASDLSGEMADIKAELITREGEGKFEGELFRVSLAHSMRSSIDKDAVILALAKKAGITDKALDNLMAANTTLADTWVIKANSRITK